MDTLSNLKAMHYLSPIFAVVARLTIFCKVFWVVFFFP